MAIAVRGLAPLLQVFDMPASVAFYRDVTLFFGCPDVDAAYRHLRGRGVAVEEPVVRDYGMKQLTVADPDGFMICFQWPAA